MTASLKTRLKTLHAWLIFQPARECQRGQASKLLTIALRIIRKSEKHLLLIAHGRRRQASNDEVRQLAESVSAQRGSDIDAVEVAFLELVEPSALEVLARCVSQGAKEIVVFPYFLAAGTHVVSDIPEAIAAFLAAHPNLRIHLTSHLGASGVLPGTILAVADR